MTEAPRPARWLAEYGRQYPAAWRQFDDFRAQRAELGNWPAWCFCPLAGAYTIVSGGINTIPPERGLHVGILGALAAWRPCQGIYRFHPAALQALWETPVEGRIPVEILEHMPEWCPYVEFDRPRSLVGHLTHGFWAHLEWAPNNDRRELRLVLDSDDGLIPVPLHLADDADLVVSLRRSLQESVWQAKRMGLDVPEVSMLLEDPATGMQLAPPISLLLYLCSQAAEMRSGSLEGPQPMPGPTKTKKGPRLFPPDRPRQWDVAFRIGASLEAAREAMAGDGTGTGEHREGPRPHVRRAHWHTYWLGKRGEQRAELRWLHPILVGGDQSGIVPTIREVEVE